MVVLDGILQLILHRSANSFLTSVLHVSLIGLGGSLAMRTHSAHGGLSVNGDHATRCGTLALHNALALRSFDADGIRCIELSETELHSQRNPGGASGGNGLGGAAELGGVSNSFSWMTGAEFSVSDFGGASCEAGAQDSNSLELESVFVLEDDGSTVVGVLRSVTTPFFDEFDVFLTDLLVSERRCFRSDFRVSY
jgi:hypothetical protein